MQRRSGNAGKLFYLSRPGISDRKYDRVFPSGQGTNHKSMLRVLSIIIIALLLLVAFQQNKVEQNYNLLHSKTQLVNDLQSRYDDLSKIVTEQNKSKVSLENQLKLAKEKVKMSQKEMKHRIPTKKSTVRAKKDSKMVLVPIADGSQEIETAVITDVLKRFGAEVFIASVKKDDDLICEMSLGMKIQADISIQEAATIKFDLIALPGGMPGATFLRDSKALKEILQQQAKEKKLIGAICASPSIVLKTHGLLGGGATGYPGNGFPLENRSDAKVVVTDNIITSQGPGTTLLFALKLGEELFGKKIAAGVAKDLLIS